MLFLFQGEIQGRYMYTVMCLSIYLYEQEYIKRLQLKTIFLKLGRGMEHVQKKNQLKFWFSVVQNQMPSSLA